MIATDFQMSESWKLFSLIVWKEICTQTQECLAAALLCAKNANVTLLCF